MRTFFKILFGFFAVLLVLAVAGYVYFDQKFKPEANYLTVSGESKETKFLWTEAYQSLLLPVSVQNKTYFMQLDFGSPYTIFYSKSIETLPIKKDSYAEFMIGDLKVSADSFKIIDYGDPIQLDSINIIGTIGTDLLEKRCVMLNFKENYCRFTTQLSSDTDDFFDFEFKKRKLIIPSTLTDQSVNLLYDSGTSAYQYITSKTKWEAYATNKHQVVTDTANSWGNQLFVHSAPCKLTFQFPNKQIPVHTITYIEGTSRIQNLLMRFSGMDAMIGNTFFLGNTLWIDAVHERMRIE